MRRDIQFLRGIAVLLVVIYHSNIGLFRQGFLGVDVFFVLSGFLITSLILKDLEKGCFSFSNFYIRRAKRLLPALYATILITTLFSFMVLTPVQFDKYLHQFIGAITFTSNMVLPSQIGYFESAADAVPLLHIWSLSLEEQYYFVLPLLLFLIPKQLRIWTLGFLFIFSLIWCLSWVYSVNQATPFLWRISDSLKSEWAFFLFPTRAWELLAGSVCAWWVFNKGNIDIPSTIKWAALLGILLLGSYSLNYQHPSYEAILIVSLTSLLLLGSDNWLPQNKFVKSIEHVGDWSYSLYLVHWPLFSLVYLSYAESVPFHIKPILIFLSLILGYSQYRYVETPFRTGSLNVKFSRWRAIGAATIIMLLIPIALVLSPIKQNDHGFTHLTRTNFGISSDCDDSFSSDGKLIDVCATANKPTLAVWGDSYAMHLIPGILKEHKEIAQLTKSACGPFRDLAPITPLSNETWAESCLKFNRNALNYITENEHVTHVVLSSSYKQYISRNFPWFYSNKGKIESSQALLTQKFNETIDFLKEKGKNVVLVSPPPRAGFNVAECIQRSQSNVALFRDHCKIELKTHLALNRDIIHFLDSAAKNVTLISLDDLLCDGDSCKTSLNNIMLYRDTGHLSIEGSEEIFRNIELFQ